jgi:hypothetical protein
MFIPPNLLDLFVQLLFKSTHKEGKYFTHHQDIFLTFGLKIHPVRYLRRPNQLKICFLQRLADLAMYSFELLN